MTYDFKNQIDKFIITMDDFWKQIEERAQKDMAAANSGVSNSADFWKQIEEKAQKDVAVVSNDHPGSTENAKIRSLMEKAEKRDADAIEKLFAIVDGSISKADIPNVLKNYHSNNTFIKSIFSKPLYFVTTETKNYVNALKSKLSIEKLEKDKQERLAKERQKQALIKAIETGGENSQRLVTDSNFIIPYGTQRIGDYAFMRCNNLLSIEIPDTVISIGKYAFYECANLSSVRIPKSVKDIGDYAFCKCAKMSIFTIPKGVRCERHAFDKIIFIEGSEYVNTYFLH